jgi:hypothetical protein
MLVAHFEDYITTPECLLILRYMVKSGGLADPYLFLALGRAFPGDSLTHFRSSFIRRFVILLRCAVVD